jgi:hypothetical protein
VVKFISIFIIALVIIVGCEGPKESKEEQAYKAYCKCVYGKHKLEGVDAEKILKDFEEGMIKEGAIKSTDAKGLRAFMEQVKASNNVSVVGNAQGMDQLHLEYFTYCREAISNSEDLLSKKGKQQVEALVQTLGSLDQLSPGLVAEIILKNIDDDVMNKKYMRMQFLLMIYTVLDKDEGIARKLPPKLDKPAPEINERDLLRIEMNGQDELMVEGILITTNEELATYVYNFYDNPNRLTELPIRIEVNMAVCDSALQHYSQLDIADSSVQTQIEHWEKKKAALLLLNGSYNELPEAAMMVVTAANNTSYEKYVEVQNTIRETLILLRNQFSMQRFGKNYTDFDTKKEADIPYVNAIRLVYPQRISEGKPKG